MLLKQPLPIRAFVAVRFDSRLARASRVCFDFISLMPSPSHIPAGEFATTLVAWYQDHKRDLPWRNTTNPYAILVSEIMLQQTTVATVRGYYDRFLARFPTAASLAAAPEQDVLTLWSGLGYYRRARSLQAAARVIVADHGGEVPQSLEELLKLPGIGRYTAGAIASFAYGQRASIVEANSARVLTRLHAVRTVLTAPASQKRLWSLAETLLPHHDMRQYNYAIMELGSLVCTPRSPLCGLCPVRKWCRAAASHATDRIPRLASKPEKVELAFTALAVCTPDHILLRHIPDGEWHAGMLEIPKVSSPQELSARLRGTAPAHIHTHHHVVTHHRVKVEVWFCRVRRTKPLPDGLGNVAWYSFAELAGLPLSSPQKRIVKAVRNHLIECGSNG